MLTNRATADHVPICLEYPMTSYPQYGQRPYEYPPMPPPVSPQARPSTPSAYRYASWWSRVGAYLIDLVVAVVPGVIVASLGLFIATAPTRAAREQFGPAADAEPNWLGVAIAVLGYLLILAIAVWNQVVRQGKTGQSLGKRLSGIAVIHEVTGRPLGPGAAFGRWAVQMTITIVGNNFLLFIPTLLNVLWPLWDAKHQTWHDKAVHSVVVFRPRTWFRSAFATNSASVHGLP